MDLIDALDRTFAHAHGVVAGVRPDQYDDKTPCAEWTVRDLLEHMIGVVDGLGAAASETAPTPFTLGAEPAAQLDAAATGAMAGWRTPGVLDRIVDGGAGPMPGHVLAGINLLDTATHTWDLATATGQPSALPDDVATAALEASRGIVNAELRPGRFGPEVPAPAGATPTQALVAFLGRTP
ncbi:MAG TPA: TIGR03086 family metal-binding protein [Acidimicrobiales bacterium]